MTPTPPNFISTPWADRLGWTLLHSVWEAIAVAALLAVVLAILRRRSPQARYAASVAAMAVLLATIGFTFWRLGADASTDDMGSVPVVLPADNSPPAAGDMSLPPATPAIPAADNPSASAHRPIESGSTVSAVAPSPISDRLAPALPWVAQAWMAGVILLCLWNLGGWIAAQRLRVLRVRPVHPDIADTAGELSRRLGLRRPVRVMESFLAQSPMVIGWLRPIVLLPASVLTGLTPRQLQAILAHELAHIRRHDYLVNLFQVLAETLLFYHPAVWWMSRWIRLEREQCCDDIAVALCGDRIAYAESLAALEEVRFARSAALAARGSGGGQLLARIHRVLGMAEARPRASFRSPRALAAAAIVFCTITALAGYRIACALANSPAISAAQIGTWGQLDNGLQYRLILPTPPTDPQAVGDRPAVEMQFHNPTDHPLDVRSIQSNATIHGAGPGGKDLKDLGVGDTFVADTKDSLRIGNDPWLLPGGSETERFTFGQTLMTPGSYEVTGQCDRVPRMEALPAPATYSPQPCGPVTLAVVQTGLPLPATLPSSQPAAPAFGPVHDVTLFDPRSDKPAAVNFDTGQTFALPAGAYLAGYEKWLSASDASVMVLLDSQNRIPCVIRGMKINLHRIDPHAWDTLSATQAIELARTEPMVRHDWWNALEIWSAAATPPSLPQTGIFQTPSGTIGLVQIVQADGAIKFTGPLAPFNAKGPLSLKLRYKTVQTAALSPDSIAAGFEPTREVTLSDGNFLDLTNGTLVKAAIPDYKGMSPAQARQARLDFCRKNGIDLIAGYYPDQKISRLIGVDMALTPVLENSLDKMPAADAEQAVARPPAHPTDVIGADMDPSTTYAFKLRDGRLGIFEIIRTADKQITLRYKLVRDSRPATQPATAPAPQGAQASTRPAGATLAVHLLDRNNRPLRRVSICMVPVSIGYSKTIEARPFWADNAGVITASGLIAGRRRFVMEAEWPTPTFLDVDVPAEGLTTTANIDWPEVSAKADLDVDVRAVAKAGRDLVHVTVTNNLDQPYTLSATDLQLVSSNCRVFPPADQQHVGAIVPAKGKGKLELTLDWQAYLAHGLWCTRREEWMEERGLPFAPGAGREYYRVCVANTCSLQANLPNPPGAPPSIWGSVHFPASEPETQPAAAAEPATESRIHLNGEVVDDVTGKPIEQFAIQAGVQDSKDAAKSVWGGDQWSRPVWPGGRFDMDAPWPGQAVWYRILSPGYRPQPITTTPLKAPAVEAGLVIRLKRGFDLHGQILDHAGQPVAGALILLAGQDELQLENGHADAGYQGSRATTDAVGQFTIPITGDGTDKIVVSCASVSGWVAAVTDPAKELTIRLPIPATLRFHCDIDGALNPAHFYVALETGKGPEWKGVGLVQTLECQNGGEAVLTNLPPGTYDVSRMHHLTIGDAGGDYFCDRTNLTLKPGETQTLDFVRTTGQGIAGTISGLKNTGIPGALIFVRDQGVSADPRDELLGIDHPFYDALTCPVGQPFKTERLRPGTYTVIGEAYGPDDGFLGERLPRLVARATVVVPEKGQTKSIRLVFKPLPAKTRSQTAPHQASNAIEPQPSAPATQPATALASPPNSATEDENLLFEFQTMIAEELRARQKYDEALSVKGHPELLREAADPSEVRALDPVGEQLRAVLRGVQARIDSLSGQGERADSAALKEDRRLAADLKDRIHSTDQKFAVEYLKTCSDEKQSIDLRLDRLQDRIAHIAAARDKLIQSTATRPATRAD